MYVLTEDAVLICDHELGRVKVAITQDWVTIHQRRVLVEHNPAGRPISGCPNVGPTIKPCTTTLAVKQGYSDFVRIDGKPLCLDTVKGLTDGTPPGSVYYKVRKPGQRWIAEAAP